MNSDKFRRQLRQEADLWRAEGLINHDLYEQLSERYQFNALEASARNRFVMILIGLGSILIGLGVITFVAANWQDLPRTGKVMLLLGLFVGVNIAGFSLWRRPSGAQQRIGHGLLLLGSLILGANMGLMGQMFHITSPFYELLLAWGVGVLAMAYSLRLTSLGVLSIILIGLGYWTYWWNFIQQSWSTPFLDELSWSSQMGQHMPLLASLMFVPLAYWCRSRVIFALAAIAVISSLEANLLPFSFRLVNLFSLKPTGLVLAIAFALPPALLWGYDDSAWVYSNFNRASNPPNLVHSATSFQTLARSFALAFLGVVFYLYSSSWFWESLSSADSADRSLSGLWFPIRDSFILISLAIWEWLRIAWLAKHSHTRRDQLLLTMVIAVFIASIVLLPLWHLNIQSISLLATWIGNGLLFLLAMGLIREGLAQGERRAFWGGMILLIVRILSWFLLSATGLVLKSLLFILCGFGVIAVGLWFERYIRTLSAATQKDYKELTD